MIKGPVLHHQHHDMPNSGLARRRQARDGDGAPAVPKRERATRSGRECQEAAPRKRILMVHWLGRRNAARTRTAGNVAARSNAVWGSGTATNSVTTPWVSRV